MSRVHDLIQFNTGLMRHSRNAPEMDSCAETMDCLLPVALDWPGFLWIMGDEIVGLTAKRFRTFYAANLSGWRDLRLHDMPGPRRRHGPPRQLIHQTGRRERGPVAGSGG